LKTLKVALISAIAALALVTPIYAHYIYDKSTPIDAALIACILPHVYAGEKYPFPGQACVLEVEVSVAHDMSGLASARSVR
jgi:hypothetical protein